MKEEIAKKIIIYFVITFALVTLGIFIGVNTIDGNKNKNLEVVKTSDSSVSNSSSSVSSISDYSSIDNLLVNQGYDQLATKKIINEIPLVKLNTSDQEFSIPVLEYHYIRSLPYQSSVTLSYQLSVAPGDFYNQMKYVADNYQTIDFPTFNFLINNGYQIPKNAIIITFDDGHRSIYNTVLAILKQYNINIEVYPVINWTGIDSAFLNWEMIKGLAESGYVTIGSHTLNHNHLSQLDNTDLINEIAGSKRIFEDTLGIHITDFSYPYGDYNEVVTQAVKNAGYLDAITTNQGLFDQGLNKYLIKRVYITAGLTIDQFIAELKNPSANAPKVAG